MPANSPTPIENNGPVKRGRGRPRKDASPGPAPAKAPRSQTPSSDPRRGPGAKFSVPHDESGIKVRNGIRAGKGGNEAVDERPPVLELDPNGIAVPTYLLPKAAGKQQVDIYVGDCREALPKIPLAKAGKVDLIFADPPFNWKRGYDSWNDDLPEKEYLNFTYGWLDACIASLRPGGSLWVNIPDDWAAEIVVFLKGRGLLMRNWCIWHYRFGQNAVGRFINSKVHALYFIKGGFPNTWNPKEVLELSDRASTYFDHRTLSKKDGMPPGMRVPLDVWYGQFFGRVQGNNAERRNYHDNQLPEAYLNRVVLCSSNPGDVVMDPFLGSGTTGVMAHALGRRFIGIEYSPVNARNAFERIKAGPVRSYTGATSSAIFAARPTSAKRAEKMAAGIKSEPTPLF